MKKTQALISKCRQFSKQYRAFCSDPSASLHSALQSMRRSSSASAMSWKIKYLDLCCAEMWMHTLALMTLMRMRKSPKSKVNPLLVEFHLTKGINMTMTHAACWISRGRVSSYANFLWFSLDSSVSSNWKSTKHWWFSDSDLHWSG